MRLVFVVVDPEAQLDVVLFANFSVFDTVSLDAPRLQEGQLLRYDERVGTILKGQSTLSENFASERAPPVENHPKIFLKSTR